MAEPGDPTDIPAHAQDLWHLVVGYVKQETVEPVRGIGRFLGWGLAGSAALGLGFVVFFLGLLRLLQEETGTAFTGHLSFVPYLITVAASGAVAGGALKARGRKKEST